MRVRRCGSIVGAMTETSTTFPPSGATRTLYRDPQDGVVAGVCAGVGRYTDTDPVIWRIVTVVLAVFGGTGAVLYLLAWLLIPKLEVDGTVGQTWLSRHGLLSKTLAVLGILALLIFGGMDDGSGVAAVAVLAAIAYVVHRERQGSPVVPSYTGPVERAPADPVTWTTPPPPYVRVPRERSRLGLATVSVAALLTGGLVWASMAGADGITPARVTATALLVVGAGLVVGTWFGRGRWLIAVGLLLCLGLGAAVAADATGTTFRGGVGERSWSLDKAPSTARTRSASGKPPST